ncbi:MAG: hypothetical protein O7G85_08390 [Planctomycetota bacterium]|nr:hypothetical protein [Planctomycetota bacterium]
MIPRSRKHKETLAWAFMLVVMLPLLMLGGCKATPITGVLSVQSLKNEPVLLESNFTTAVFTNEPQTETSFWLSDVSVQDLLAGRVVEGQIVHVEMIWSPKAGSTPMDSSATNASIRYVVISHGEVGIYIGAGYAIPSGDLQGSSVTLSIRDASLRLGESTPGFIDLLGPAQISGQFTATRDAKKARSLFVSVSQYVTDSLGKTRFVKNSVAPKTKSNASNSS